MLKSIDNNLLAVFSLFPEVIHGLNTWCSFSFIIKTCRICCAAKDSSWNTLAKKIEDEQNLLNESIEKLKVVESNRFALVSQLQDALHEQVNDRFFSRITFYLFAELEDLGWYSRYLAVDSLIFRNLNWRMFGHRCRYVLWWISIYKSPYSMMNIQL